MKERKETISITKANIWAVVLLVAAIVIAVPYYMFVTMLLGHEPDFTLFRYSDDVQWYDPLIRVVVLFVVLVAGTVVHELIHGVTWARYCNNGWRSINFGIKWKALMPYCHCSEPLAVPQYRLGALMPFYVLGVLPLLISPFIPSFALALFGAFFISAAAGDLMVAWRLRKEKPTATIVDHPTEPGYLIYEEENEAQ